ncbi:hypothetical protein ANCCEY_10481 [Ancylostoma ceylanicum]|uniref:Uncharacterized protein n=1 Tax=Ancylostoma ceylanicum TaxID=53326 RepID=A0A0D6LS13_9BILA|nr:hypothetical protein ANCCEY_10481 [Ancylostoma ceylanicum]
MTQLPYAMSGCPPPDNEHQLALKCVVMPREGSDDVTRDNWTRRFSKTVLANLVPFRKVVTSDEAKSPPPAAASKDSSKAGKR